MERKSQVRDGELVWKVKPSAGLLGAEMEKNSPAAGELKPANAKAPGTKATAFRSQWTICLETFSRPRVIDYMAFLWRTPAP